MSNELRAEDYFQKLTSYLNLQTFNDIKLNIVKVDYIRNHLLLSTISNDGHKLIKIPFTELHLEDFNNINNDIKHIINTYI